MKKEYSVIKDISFINSNTKTKKEFVDLFKNGLFENTNSDNYVLSEKINNLGESINSRLRNRMSQLSLGIYSVIENGPQEINPDEEICLFTSFGEIETTNIILNNILIEKLPHVSPTHFHNSVHHTALGYYTIIKGIHNPCVTISDGLSTNKAFIDYIQKRVKLKNNLIVAAGDEYSNFFKLDITNNLKLMPVFGSYRLITQKDKGFCYEGTIDNIEKLNNLENYKDINTLIADKNTFNELKGKTDKKLLTDYPVTLDSPCSLAFRLAFPFYFDIKGITLVIQKIKNLYYYFEVAL